LEHSTPLLGHDPSIVHEANGSYTLYIKTFDLPTTTPKDKPNPKLIKD